MSSSAPSPYPATDQDGLSRKRKQQQNEFVSHMDLPYDEHEAPSSASHFDNIYHHNDLQWQMMQAPMSTDDQHGFSVDPMFAFQPTQGINFTSDNTHGFNNNPTPMQHGQPHDQPFQDMGTHPAHANNHAFANNMFHMPPSDVDNFHLRRHSVAVGELMHHPEQNSPYLDMSNPEMNYDRFRTRHMSTQDIHFGISNPFHAMQYQQSSPQTMFGEPPDHSQTLPTPPQSANPIQRRQSKSATTMTKTKARNTQRNRAMSLRLDISGSPSLHNTGASMQQSSPLTPAFFSPAFLEALNADTQSSADEADIYPFPVHSGSESVSDAQFVDPSKTMNNARTNADDPNSNFYSSSSPIDPTLSDVKPSPSSSYMIEQKPFLAQQHATPTIMEENEELFKNLADYGSHVQLPTQPPINGLGIRRQSDHFTMQDTKILYRSPSGGVTDMRSAIGQFLSSPTSLAAGEYTMMILTSKVAQKSYGTEKRLVYLEKLVLPVFDRYSNGLPDIVFVDFSALRQPQLS